MSSEIPLAASYDNHEKINSWVHFAFLYEYGTPIGGPVLGHVSFANVSGFTMIVGRIKLVLLPAMVNLIQPKSTVVGVGESLSGREKDSFGLFHAPTNCIWVSEDELILQTFSTAFSVWKNILHFYLSVKSMVAHFRVQCRLCFTFSSQLQFPNFKF